MRNRAPRHRLSATRGDALAWGRLSALALGAMTFGIVAGAAFAAPGELMPVARSVGGALARAIEPVLSSALSWSEQAVGTASGTMSSVLAGDAPPRTLAMTGVAMLAGIFGLTALVLTYTKRPGVPAGTSMPNLSINVAPVSNGRRSGHPTPKQVLILAQQGASLTDIARRAGMSVDAVSVLLAIADPARQLPTRAA